MKTTIVLLLIIFSTKGLCQLSSPKKVLLDISLNKTIEHENQTYPTIFEKITERRADDGTVLVQQTPVIDTVAADLIVNYTAKNGTNQIYIRSSSASVNGDTLEISLFNHSAYISWEYRILIIKDIYQIETWFTPPINHKKIQILPTTTVFKINSLDFSKGRELKGYTKLQGQCQGDDQSCFSRDIIIEGNFKVKIK